MTGPEAMVLNMELPITHLKNTDYTHNYRQDGLYENRDGSEGHSEEKGKSTLRHLRQDIPTIGLGRKESVDHIGRVRMKGLTKEEYLERYRRVARERGGECLSDEYVDSRTKLEVECSEGHKWMIAPGNLLFRKWCRECANNNLALSGKEKKKYLVRYQRIAEEQGGECLSKEYVNAKNNMQFQCKEGHKWWTFPRHINNGHWCPFCAGNAKHTMEYMHALAKHHGGKCLSTKYINTHTKMEWQCSKGHKWHTKPIKIIIGRWCEICGRKRAAKLKIRHTIKLNEIENFIISECNNQGIKIGGIA